MILSLSLFALTIVLGGVLLTPSLGRFVVLSRGTIAMIHGAIGTLGLVLLYAALITSSAENPVGWVSAVLISVGLIAGVVLFFGSRHGRRPPVLVVALHVIMAGMGAMLLIGFALG